MSPSTRLKEFPGEYLAVRAGKLFCTACREELALKNSTIKNHIACGDKHQIAKKKILKGKARERDIAESLNKETQPLGTHVSMDERVYRARVVENFLQAGIPLGKIDALLGLLEENAFRLTHSSHLANYIPPILMNEKQAIRNELKDKDIGCV